MRTLLLLFALACLAPALAAPEPPVPAALPTTAEIAAKLAALGVRDDIVPYEARLEVVKIAALGVRDDIVPYEARPEVWLARHIEVALPAVIAGLDNAEPRIREGCLQLLAKAPPADTIRAALLRVAESAEHPLAGPALVALCRYVADARVKEVLSKGVADAQRLPDPEDRAKLAETVGDRAAAVALLLPVLAQQKYPYQKRPIIEWLARLNHASALSALGQLAKSNVWETSVAACLALDQIETSSFRLTPDQKEFLQESGRMGKESGEAMQARWAKLAELKRAEIRPFVLHMLASDRPEPALTILVVWQDRAALPEIQRAFAAQKERTYKRADFAVALLSLLPDDAGAAAVAAQFKPGDDSERMLNWVWQSEVPPARKLAFFRELRNGAWRDLPGVLASQLRLPEAELGSVLVPLLRAETDVTAVALLTERLAETDRQHQYGAEIATAFGKVLAAQQPAWQQPAQVIQLLHAFALSADPAVAPAVCPLLTDQNAPLAVRLAATQVLATCGVDRAAALQTLYAALGAADPASVQQAAEAVATLPWRDDAERAVRETVALAYLGKPGESNALRILATCAGAESARQVAPLLDGNDAGRALLAAWVLAQDSDGTVRTTGLRRLAIYAMFNHQEYQAGSGIDFQIAPEIRLFRQLLR